MSVRTHAPGCAKTRALIESEEGRTECCHVECTCGATYGPGVEAQRDEARAMFEASSMSTAMEWSVRGTCPPWLTEDDWLAKYRSYRGLADG